jgi:hypothetical protein
VPGAVSRESCGCGRGCGPAEALAGDLGEPPAPVAAKSAILGFADNLSPSSNLRALALISRRAVCGLAGTDAVGREVVAGTAGVGAAGCCGLAGVAAGGLAGLAAGVCEAAGVPAGAAAAGFAAPPVPAGAAAFAASCFAGAFRRSSVEEPVPTSMARKFSSVISLARMMCGVMAKTISSSRFSRLSCANRYLRMGILLTQG